jgi:DNA polymerase-3 subunit alpha
VFAARNYRSIASLDQLDDRGSFKIAGAIVQVDKKFTKKEGKPFAVIWIEDLMNTLEVVVWNEVYVKISEGLVAGRVVEVKGTLDKREDVVRATAVEIKFFAPAKTNGADGTRADTGETAVLLRFSDATTGDDLRKVREILIGSPGRRAVQLLFDRGNEGPLRLCAGAEFRIALTADVEEKLSAWLIRPSDNAR